MAIQAMRRGIEGSFPASRSFGGATIRMEIEPPRRLLVNPATDPLFRSRWSLPRLTGRAGALDQNLRRTWFSLVGEVIRVADPTPALTLSSYRLGRNSACLLLLMAMSTACSSSDQIEQQSRTAASTAQTVSMTLDAWAAGAAPPRTLLARCTRPAPRWPISTRRSDRPQRLNLPSRLRWRRRSRTCRSRWTAPGRECKRTAARKCRRLKKIFGRPRAPWPPLTSDISRRSHEEALGNIAGHRHQCWRLPGSRIDGDGSPGRRDLRVSADLGGGSRHHLHHFSGRDGRPVCRREPSHDLRRDPGTIWL